jgi:hypothetical protein
MALSRIHASARLHLPSRFCASLVAVDVVASIVELFIIQLLIVVVHILSYDIRQRIVLHLPPLQDILSTLFQSLRSRLYSVLCEAEMFAESLLQSLACLSEMKFMVKPYLLSTNAGSCHHLGALLTIIAEAMIARLSFSLRRDARRSPLDYLRIQVVQHRAEV